jgi:hypothetical protein
MLALPFRVVQHCTVLVALFACTSAQRDAATEPMVLALNNFVGDHMVLAREPLSASVWGNATAGSKVTVSLDDKAVASAVATPDGRWKASLPPQPAGTDHAITVTDGSTTIKIVDVAFGDVRAPCHA